MGAPALLDAQALSVLEFCNALLDAVNNWADGAAVSDGGTTQAAGAGGALNYDIDTTVITDGRVEGERHILAAQTDADSDAGAAVAWGAVTDVSVIFAVVLETGAGNDTPAIVAVAGDVATTGAEVAPTAAVIEAALGHSNYVLLCEHTVNRTATTTVTHAYSYANKEDGSIPTWASRSFAETEASYQG